MRLRFLGDSLALLIWLTAMTLGLLGLWTLRAWATEGRVYHLVSVADLATTEHTHVCVRGEVMTVKREPDGDLHVKVQDGDAFIIAEQIPGLKATGDPPKVGQTRVVCGISRFDRKHQWPEVHPVESWHWRVK